MSSNFVRLGGLAGMVAGAMYLLIGIVNQFAPQEIVFISLSDYLIEVLYFVALLGTLVAIAGLHSAQSGSYGVLGTVGSVAAAVGFVLLLVVSLVTLLVGGAVLGILTLLGVLVALVGLVLLGIATIRARVLPWWCGLLLIVVFPLSIVLNVVAGAGGFLLGIVWGLVGFVLLSSGQASAREPSRVS